MKRASTVLTAVLVVGLMATAAGAASVSFAPVGSTTVAAGVPIEADLTLNLDGFGNYDFVHMLIGSNDAADLGFVLDANWASSFPSNSATNFDPGTIGLYAQEVEINGYNEFGSLTFTSMPVGRITIDTTAMAVGDYTLVIDGGESEVALVADEGGSPASITGSMPFSIVPEPVCLAPLALGAVALIRRRG